ncbi:adenosine deaminase CECR1 [Alternaria panax]|uniref:adenosine deaminase n=1 Tax=Alternaria panax TaxID=48097 RepID=A0AAD4IBC4_9PLEO|nr:adenosine deaminase CECR1 [Alternaria panax]
MTMLPTPNVPSTYPNESAYWSAREALQADEKSLAFTAGLRFTPTESRASTIVSALRAQEKETLYGRIDDAGSFIEHAHQYMPAKHIIDTTKLLSIAKRAPKGALLHCHLDAMLPPLDSLIKSARGRKGLCISLDMKSNCLDWMKKALPVFQMLPADDAEKAAEISFFDPIYIPGVHGKGIAYQPGTWTTWSRFCEEFPGGQSAAENFVAKRILLNREDVYHTSQTVDGIWHQFNRAFATMRGLLLYQSAFTEHFRLVLRDLVADNISYAEIRVAFHRYNDVWTDDGTHTIPRPELLKLMNDIIKSEVATAAAAGKTFYGVKIIFSALRSGKMEDMEYVMDECIALKQEYPELICGFDMCGQEDAGYPLTHWVPSLLQMRSKCDELGVDLPFVLHAGETLSHGTETDGNLFDALLLNSKRIGHGFSIAQHPLLMEMCKTRGVAIEVCPISNEVLGLCPGVRSHPMTPLLAFGVPCTINSDDPGVFSSSLSHDFYQTMIGSESMDLAGWRKLIEWSFEYSCMSSEEKTTRLAVFKTEWEAFCEGIVDEYSEALNLEAP